MPFKLVPPSKDRRTPYFSVRGTYLGVYVDRSTKTGERRQANKVLKGWEEQIERGEYGKLEAVVEAPKEEQTFAGAAIAYMNSGGERRFLTQAIEELGRLALSKIDQAEIDAAAMRAFPKGTPAYRNRNFYTPVSAVPEARRRRQEDQAAERLAREEAHDVVGARPGVRAVQGCR
jgi:hypothetical protein